jgi:hypothetical protein
MRSRCGICTVAAFAAIGVGAILIIATLPGWAWLTLLGAALIVGGLIWLWC